MTRTLCTLVKSEKLLGHKKTPSILKTVCSLVSFALRHSLPIDEVHVRLILTKHMQLDDTLIEQAVLSKHQSEIRIVPQPSGMNKS